MHICIIGIPHPLKLHFRWFRSILDAAETTKNLHPLKITCYTVLYASLFSSHYFVTVRKVIIDHIVECGTQHYEQKVGEREKGRSKIAPPAGSKAKSAAPSEAILAPWDTITPANTTLHHAPQL